MPPMTFRMPAPLGRALRLGALLALSCISLGAQAAEAQVAVAANFAEPMKAIAKELQKSTGHTLKVSVGGTGKLYAQIRNGAPFDLLLAADTLTPQRLESDGLAIAGSRFTYATGRLVLWSAKAGRVDGQGAVLQSPDLGKVAMAAPKLAPYGAAAVEVTDRLGLTSALASKLVQGESIGQTFTFVYTGNADVGFVAMSQVLEGGRLKSGSMWVIPQDLYTPIRQDAIVLQQGAGNEAVRALVDLLKSPKTRELIRSYGYAS